MNRLFVIYGIVLLICLLTLSGLMVFKERVLIIEEDDNGKVVWQEKLQDDMNFAIKYLHSVEQTPVWEYFAVKDGKIFLTGTRYQSYGAGLPFLKRHDYRLEGDYFVIREINTQLDSIPLRVSDYAKHRFIYDNNEYKLYQMLTPQSLVLIKVERINKLKLFYREARIWLKR